MVEDLRDLRLVNLQIPREYNNSQLQQVSRVLGRLCKFGIWTNEHLLYYTLTLNLNKQFTLKEDLQLKISKNEDSQEEIDEFIFEAFQNLQKRVHNNTVFIPCFHYDSKNDFEQKYFIETEDKKSNEYSDIYICANDKQNDQLHKLLLTRNTNYRLPKFIILKSYSTLGIFQDPDIQRMRDSALFSVRIKKWFL